MTVPSPCINVCEIERGICRGCARTLDEIAAWTSASDAVKRRILDGIARRRRP